MKRFISRTGQVVSKVQEMIEICELRKFSNVSISVVIALVGKTGICPQEITYLIPVFFREMAGQF